MYEVICEGDDERGTMGNIDKTRALKSMSSKTTRKSKNESRKTVARLTDQ